MTRDARTVNEAVRLLRWHAAELLGRAERELVDAPDGDAYNRALNRYEAACHVTRAVAFLDGWHGQDA